MSWDSFDVESGIIELCNIVNQHKMENIQCLSHAPFSSGSWLFRHPYRTTPAYREHTRLSIASCPYLLNLSH